jgi:hypothetical protein
MIRILFPSPNPTDKIFSGHSAARGAFLPPPLPPLAGQPAQRIAENNRRCWLEVPVATKKKSRVSGGGCWKNPAY